MRKAYQSDLLVPEEVMSIWMREWAKEDVQIEREKLQEEPKYPSASPQGFWLVISLELNGAHKDGRDDREEVCGGSE